MTVTTNYRFEFIEALDPGGITLDADLASLANGGVALTGTGGGNTDTRIFEADGDLDAQRLNLPGTRAHVGELSTGNLVIASINGAGQAAFSLYNPVTNATAGPSAVGFAATVNALDVTGGISGGRFAIVASTSDGLRLQLRSNVGALIETSIVSLDATDRKPSIATLTDGRFVVAFQKDGGTGAAFYCAIFEPDGSIAGPPGTGVTSLSSTAPINRNVSVVALEGGGFAVAYETGDAVASSVKLARWSADGAYIDQSIVYDNVAPNTSVTTTRLSNGMIVVGAVINSASDDPAWRLVDPSTGAVLASDQTSGTSGTDTLTIAATAEGRFAAVYTSSPGDLAGQVMQATRSSVGDGAADVIVGDSLRDVVFGGGGADAITGGGGADELRGGDDADIFLINAAGEAAAGELIDGGEGGSDFDTLQVKGSLNAFSLNLAGLERLTFASDLFSTQQIALRADQIGPGLEANALITGRPGTDVLRVVMFGSTSVSLSGLFFDAWETDQDRVLIAGDNDGESIGGSNIRDDIAAGGGRDFISGGAGDDVISGGAGNDDMDGGDGIDTLDYRDKTVGVVVSVLDGVLTGGMIGGVAEDQIFGFENVQGGSGPDVLTGDGAVNVLIGNGGNDILRSGAGVGQDILQGGAGVDFGDYRDETDPMFVQLNGAGETIVYVNVPSPRDVISGIEGLLAGSGSDNLTGDQFGNTFRGGGGADTLNGGAGLDAVDFRDKTAVVQLTLAGSANAIVTVGGVAEDTIRNFEIVYGGAASDRLTGDVLDNQLLGNGGADLLRGGRGADIVTGGAGADVFFYNALNESTVAAVGRDTIRDFSRAQGDRIYLAVIDANTSVANDQAFTLGAVGVAGRLQVTSLNPLIHLVQGDVNGGGADFAILVYSPTAPVASDFVL